MAKPGGGSKWDRKRFIAVLSEHLRWRNDGFPAKVVAASRLILF
jgi:hypothetical protein